jgi:hypothetical protein
MWMRQRLFLLLLPPVTLGAAARADEVQVLAAGAARHAIERSGGARPLRAGRQPVERDRDPPVCASPVALEAWRASGFTR